jgi:hypothetical protein
MANRRTGRSRAAVAALLLTAVVGGTLTLAACGGSGKTASSPLGATPTPSVAASPEHLVGMDSVALTNKTVAAYTATSNAGCARQGALYARDVVFHCYATGVHVEGRAAMVALLKDVRSVTTGSRALAAHAGHGLAAVVWTASSTGSGGSGVTMLEIRDGKIARETLYYNSSLVPFTTTQTAG